MAVVPFEPRRAALRPDRRPSPPAAPGVPPTVTGLPIARTTQPGAAARPPIATPPTSAGLRSGNAPMLPSLPPLPSASGASRTGRTVAPAAPEPPRLAVNLSPDAATRLLSGLGLGVALCATVATTTALVAGMGTATPQALLALTGWLVSLPWLFVSVVLLACARIERLVRPADAAAWTSLAVVALGAAALQVVGRELVSGPALAARAGLLIVAAAAVSVFFRQFFRGAPKVVRQQLAAGVFGGLFAGLGPFTLLGATLLPATDHTASLDALLAGSDALVALVLGTFAVHAALVYVRDFLPDFNIALETNADSDARRVSAAR